MLCLIYYISILHHATLNYILVHYITSQVLHFVVWYWYGICSMTYIYSRLHETNVNEHDTVLRIIKHNDIECNTVYAKDMYIHTYIHAYMHTCIYTYIHANVHTYLLPDTLIFSTVLVYLILLSSVVFSSRHFYSFLSFLFYAMICYALPCSAWLSTVMLCCDLLCCDMAWCGVTWYDTVWYSSDEMRWFDMVWYDLRWPIAYQPQNYNICYAFKGNPIVIIKTPYIEIHKTNPPMRFWGLELDLHPAWTMGWDQARRLSAAESCARALDLGILWGI